MDLTQLEGLKEKILSLPRQAQLRVLDDVETIIEHQGFVTVGEVNMLIREQLH
jgi:hypothetical protein